MATAALTKAFPATLKEIRFHLCQSGPASAGARWVLPFRAMHEEEELERCKHTDSE
jgi:hypothetical protein